MFYIYSAVPYVNLTFSGALIYNLMFSCTFDILPYSMFSHILWYHTVSSTLCYPLLCEYGSSTALCKTDIRYCTVHMKVKMLLAKDNQTCNYAGYTSHPM